MKNDTDDILDALMSTVESWRTKTASSINPNHQTTAFHVGALTEETFRMHALTGGFLMQDSMNTHVRSRETIFAAEWALRSLQLPNHIYSDINHIRDSWNDKTASKCIKILTELSKYYHVRDLVISTKRGGYTVERVKQNTFVFNDVPNWTGSMDLKSRLISNKIESDRFKDYTSNFIKTRSLKDTPAYDDFPNAVKGHDYSGSDFWNLWEYLFRLSLNAIAQGCNVHNYGAFAATSETKELCIFVTKKKINDQLIQNAGLNKSAVSIFLKWLTFNSQTPRKFTLFHCPLVDVNDKFVMIIPHAILMAHPPTIFLRLLANYDKAAFDSASSLLEKKALNRLKIHLEGQGRVIKTNVKLDTLEGQLELDFVEYDESDSTLCIGQAKLTIRADSVSEVDHTNEALKKGLIQLQKNKSAVHKNYATVEAILAKLGVSTKKDIKIEYFLMPTLFTGSDFLKIPNWVKVLPMEFCLRSQCEGFSIRSTWAQYKKLWDSFDTKDISSKSQFEFELAGLKIYYPGFAI